MRTITALALAALAEAATPYGIESFDSVLKPLWKGIRQHRGKVRFKIIIVHLGPPQIRKKNCYRLDNFLVVDSKKPSMTKHLECKSSYRLLMVKNKVVENKLVFLLKRKTILVVDDKQGSFVIDNSLSPICD